MICPLCDIIDTTGIHIDADKGWWPCPLSDDCPCTTYVEVKE